MLVISLLIITWLVISLVILTFSAIFFIIYTIVSHIITNHNVFSQIIAIHNIDSHIITIINFVRRIITLNSIISHNITIYNIVSHIITIYNFASHINTNYNILFQLLLFITLVVRFGNNFINHSCLDWLTMIHIFAEQINNQNSSMSWIKYKKNKTEFFCSQNTSYNFTQMEIWEIDDFIYKVRGCDNWPTVTKLMLRSPAIYQLLLKQFLVIYFIQEPILDWKDVCYLMAIAKLKGGLWIVSQIGRSSDIRLSSSPPGLI